MRVISEPRDPNRDFSDEPPGCCDSLKDSCTHFPHTCSVASHPGIGELEVLPLQRSARDHALAVETTKPLLGVAPQQ